MVFETWTENDVYLQGFFGPTTGVASLKLMDEGVPRDKFVLVTLPTLPALMVLPFALSRYMTKKRALGAFLVCFAFRCGDFPGSGYIARCAVST